jgi:hypothetical protein
MRTIVERAGMASGVEMAAWLLVIISGYSFSKKLDNHIGAVWFFIYHYNTQPA